MHFKRFCIALVSTVVLAGCASGPRPSPGTSDTGEASSQARVQSSAAQKQKFNQALADIKAGKLETAQTTLIALVADEPGLTNAQNNLGVVYRQLGKFKQAESAYQAALNADPDNAKAHLNLGILYDVYLQQPAQALAQYERYQALSKEKDKEVALWIADLKRRL